MEELVMVIIVWFFGLIFVFGFYVIGKEKGFDIRVERYIIFGNLFLIREIYGFGEIFF